MLFEERTADVLVEGIGEIRVEVDKTLLMLVGSRGVLHTVLEQLDIPL